MKALDKVKKRFLSVVRKPYKLRTVSNMPMILSAINTTDEIQYDIEFLKAAVNIANDKSKELVVIEYCIGSISINEVYGWLLGNKINIAEIHIESINCNSIQGTTISIVNKDIIGNEVGRFFTFRLDEYQVQKGQSSIYAPSIINALTSLVLSEIKPKDTIKLYLYPFKSYIAKFYYFWQPKFWKIKREDKV